MSLFVSTFLPMRVACFQKTPLYHKQELLFIEGKKHLLISCQISPKENDELVAGQLGTNARNTPYTLCSKFKPILLRSLKNVF